jgi:hypothetical protein
MQSPAPGKQRIRRSDSCKETKEAFDIIENIEAVTEAEEDKKQEAEESSDSSDSTITEREVEEDKDSPETDGGSKKAVEALEVLAIPASTSGVVGTSESSSSSSTSTSTSTSSSSSSSSTAGSDKSVDTSSSDSSDSSRSYSDSESDSSEYNKMPSSITKSPVSHGSRATFEEWHSLWEVFGQEQGFDEYQTIVPHPDLLVDGHNAVKPVKTEKKALRKNKKAIASLRVSFSGVYTVDAMIEGTIDDAGMWPYVTEGRCTYLRLSHISYYIARMCAR